MPKSRFICTEKNSRLDNFLTRETGGKFSRAQIQRWIGEGRVKVNGRAVNSKSFISSPKDKIELEYNLPKLEARADIPLAIIYEDDDVLVLDKPPGLVVHPAPAQNKPSVAAALLAKYPGLKGLGDEFRPGIAHRLDADTSGLLIAAKHGQSLAFLKREFAERRVEKFYLALVHGILPKPHGVFDQPIGRKAGQKKFSAGFGREARTEYWLEETFNGGVGPSGVDSFSLVRIQLHTGRTHQIRVHFAAGGHPVAGDGLYGGRFKKTDASFFPRQFLHAASLKLRLPSGREKKFESPLPPDLRAVIKRLNSNKP